MPEIGPPHPLTYRSEVTTPLFDAIHSGDSSVIVGAASMGKSRLAHFLQRADVQHHYLADRYDKTLIVWCDCNRMAQISEWGLYEIMLTGLLESASERDAAPDLCAELSKLRAESVVAQNALLAQRNLEWAAQLASRRWVLCIILDEFDETFRALPPQALANLRALRDRNRYSLCYTLLVRDTLARLRPQNDVEGFGDLFMRPAIGLGPYQQDDAQRVLQQLAERKHKTLSPSMCAHLLDLSGGHPGLLVALVDAVEDPVIEDAVPQNPLELQPIRNECAKLWRGLAHDEQQALNHLAQDIAVADKDTLAVLQLKGLLHNAHQNSCAIFTPLFAQYAAMQNTSTDRLWVDTDACAVYVGQKKIEGFAAKEFALLTYLYAHLNHVCKRQELLAHLYPDDKLLAPSDNRLDSLVKRTRKRLGENNHAPKYLVTVQSVGFKLLEA